MNTNLITYENKETLNTNPSIPSVNKVESDNMNEIKSAINTGLLNLIYPVGCYFETSDSNFNPNTSWGGTWELETDGTVLVSKSTTSGSKFNVDVGTVIGEETHKLTIAEMPAHKHELTIEGGGSLTASGVKWLTGTNMRKYGGDMIENAGGNQAHNNVQPSKVINRWHRTA